jgi:hypothetical protein
MSTTGVNELETKHVITQKDPKVAIVENTNVIDSQKKTDHITEVDTTKPDQTTNQNVQPDVSTVNKVDEKKVGSDSEDEDDGAEEVSRLDILS